MKHRITHSLMLLLFLISCKKDQQTDVTAVEAGPKVPVSFNAAVAPGDSASVATSLQQLYYLVYDSKGVEVARRQQALGDDQFASAIKDSLRAGTYTVVVAASDQPFYGSHSIGINGGNYPDYYVIKSNLRLAYLELALPTEENPIRVLAPDIFFAKDTLSIQASPHEQRLTLKRIVGKLEVNLEDAMPDSADRLYITNTREHYRYLFPSEQSDQETDQNRMSIPITPSDIGKRNFRASMYILNTDSPIDVTIAATNANHKLIATTTVKNVQMYKNKRTILTGKLFSSSNAQAAFKVTVNPTWSADTVVKNF